MDRIEGAGVAILQGSGENRMNSHKNARRRHHGRAELVRRLLVEGRTASRIAAAPGLYRARGGPERAGLRGAVRGRPGSPASRWPA
ncbi:MAG: hypothetical protein IID49_01855 [Proteobacteria bacterium]|nr:hypothetical protein [Pseudomonadota bacterium]MCH8950856.1 hypothetical protein [Pseudomonadota bacterium]